MASVVKVNVKHNQTIYNDVEINLEEPVAVLKAQLWTLTGVPPERQKVLIKGLLKDDTNLQSLQLKDGQRIMLIGTSEGNEIKQPVETRVFIEDLSVDQRKILFHENNIDDLPSGLQNFGNTCFLNSVIQFLKPVKELTKMIDACTPHNGSENDRLILGLQRLHGIWNISITKFDVLRVLSEFQAAFPDLFKKEKLSGPQAMLALSGYIQQDAEQLLSSLLNVLKIQLPRTAIDSLFGISTESLCKCMEDENEDEEASTEKFLVFPCHLSSTTSPVHDLYASMKASMETTIEKMSSRLQKNAAYKKTMRLSSVPPFLIVQFVRFEWKKAQGLAKAGRAKICRKIHFPLCFDVYDFCSETLQKKFLMGKKLVQARKDKEIESATLPTETAPTVPPLEETASTVPPLEETAAAVPPSEICDGRYDLCAIITHRGRTADSGHYVAWNKKDDETWIKFDDDKVSYQKWSAFDLCGGLSDYHIAYLCMYKRRVLNVSKEEITFVQSMDTS